MKVAVVILNWNGKKLLAEFLPKVIEYSSEAELYVIDNASSGDDVAYLKQNFPQIKIIENTKNFGFAGGYNQGLKSINADVYCLLNSDVEVTPNWLQPIINLFEKDKEISVIQPKILDYNNRDYFEYAGAGGGFLDNFGYPFCRGRIFWTLEKDENQYNDEIPIFWATGACMFIKSEVFWEMNGFDEDFFAHMEEIDLCWRIQNKGYKIYYSGLSTVYHVGGGTLKKNSPNKTYLNFRNNLWMLTKNLPSYKLIPIIFSRLVLDGVTAIVFWKYEGFSHLKAIFRAHMSFYSKLPLMLKKREETKRKFWLKRFVPFQYFILGRKKIKDIV
ncbi:glycosyltransferase family 2 protein [Weeksellaceae bacterium TAE3-ERU29]|nr:glycosyltransferase family 2 protein [Weeksellaceae bacterium TAE3-ERU29]